MILAVCLDDDGGMAYKNMRQTEDTVQREKLLALAVRSKMRIVMNSYTGKLFGYDTGINSNDELLKAAAQNVICFIENAEISEFIKKADTVVLYKWNNRYPSDLKFDFSLLNNYELKSSISFKGIKHDKITEEIYIKIQ